MTMLEHNYELAKKRVSELLSANNEEVTKRRAAETALLDRNEQNEALQVALTAANKQGVVDQLSINELKQANQDVTVRNSNQAVRIRELETSTATGILLENLNDARKQRDAFERVLNCVRKERDAYCVQRNIVVEERDQLKAHIAFLEIKKASTVGEVRPDILKDLQDEINTVKWHCETARTALKTRTAERDKLQNILDNPYQTEAFLATAWAGLKDRATAAEKKLELIDECFDKLGYTLTVKLT